MFPEAGFMIQMCMDFLPRKGLKGRSIFLHLVTSLNL